MTAATTDRGTMLDLVDRNAARHPDLPAIVAGEVRLTWSRYRRRARAVALALLDLGVRPGEVVGLHMVNRAEHPLADIGALYAGAVPTSFYNTLAPDQLAYVAGDCAAVVAVVDADKVERWLAIRDHLPRLRHLVAVGLGRPSRRRTACSGSRSWWRPPRTGWTRAGTRWTRAPPPSARRTP